MTSELERYRPERQVDITVGTIRNFILYGEERYTDAHRRDDKRDQMYWDGYVRACQHILEADGQ